MTTTALPPLVDAGDVARAALAILEDAWNRGDGAAFGAPYTDDATFVTIRGELHRGAAIGAGHAGIFATIYAGSTNKMELVDARQVGADTVVMTSCNTLDAPHGPLAGVHQAMSTSVLVRQGDAWRIVASHNTLVLGG